MCSCRLADAGARVIKIERPEGDFARGYDNLVHGESAYFIWLNRGKELAVLDLNGKADKAVLESMLGKADVFIQNLKPGALKKLGFSIERLHRDYPSLILCSISGYGESGPYAGRKAYDLLIQADSGLASITGGPEGPARVGVSVVDIATGLNAYEAILEALLLRGRTGKGSVLSVSMFAAMADWMTVPLLQTEGGKPPRRMGLAHPSIAPYGVFKTKDGIDILISIQNDREWRLLAEKVLANPALGAGHALRAQCRPRGAARGDRWACCRCFRRANGGRVDRSACGGRCRVCAGDRYGRSRQTPAPRTHRSVDTHRSSNLPTSACALGRYSAKLRCRAGSGSAHGSDPR